MKELAEIKDFDPRTVQEIRKRFEAMAQPNSLSVVLLAGEMVKEGSWHQPTLEYISEKAQAEHDKGPNQMVAGWSSWLQNLSTNIQQA